ncbi:hypothetical protein C8Q70DRAFT_1054741 [Cubamyces menziesii]|nr:hypothetical protein C8Q70DRAFT_1054741 [Cubamyces menziesii]
MPFESSAVIGGMRLSRVAGIVGIAIYATVAIGFIAYDIYKKKPDNIRVADTGSGLPDRVEVPAPLQDGSASCARVGLSPIEEVSEKEPSSSSEKLLAVNIVDTGLSASASAAPKFEPDVESSAPSHSPCQDDGDVLVPTSSHSDHTQNEAEAEANMGSPIVDNDQWLPPSSPSTFLNFTGLMSSPSTTIDQSDNAESDMDDAGSDSDHLTMSSLWSPVGAPSAVLSLSDITSRAGSTVDSDSDSEDFDLLSPRSEYFSPTNSSSDLL